MLPSISLIIATPAVMIMNTIANPTDNADVYLNESNILPTQLDHVIPLSNKSNHHCECKTSLTILHELVLSTSNLRS